MIDDVTIDVFIGPLYGSLRKFCTRCVLYVEPHSGPRRAERAKMMLANQPRGAAGDIKAQGPSAGSIDHRSIHLSIDGLMAQSIATSSFIDHRCACH